MNEKQIEKKAQREADRIDQFQQRKRAEELTNGMELRNSALEQLGHKIKEEEVITVSAQAAGDEAAAWAANCAEKKYQYPSRTLCYSVSVALQAPEALKIEKQENGERSNQNTKDLCAVIRKERCDEVATAGTANNAARKRRAMAVLKSALAKKWEMAAKP